MQLQDLETTLYFGYGANTNTGIMRTRCPNAQLIGIGSLSGYKLCFHKFLTIEEHKNSVVQGAVWKLTKRDLKNLDKFENVPQSYTRILVSVQTDNELRLCWTYQMQPGQHKGEPADASYVERVKAGYQTLGLPIDHLLQAAKRAGL